ncbi:glycoside hydrolase [Streptomyces sp. DH12]|uniref:glycoside hydrolase family 30 protein n=1 Tax=Streptomyces sp. DH12 TaxID=2857010 RepID=UPI001E2EB223|nr:glycoside hydrolase [Streptomyces sp. DH12]
MTALTAVLMLALTWQATATPARPASDARPATDRRPATDARPVIDFRTQLQPIDGFGFSMAFQRADLLFGARGLGPAKQREVLDLLLSKEKGAGLSILRLGIGSSTDRVYDHMPTILPTDPGGPHATPKYVWDGWDAGQVRLAKEAEAYGVRRFFADAWSAPAFMKSNGSENDGGELLPAWRQAYADYLVQYARFYQREGIRITDLGFTNEPDWTATYASMRFTPQQAVDFLKVLGPTVRASGLKTRLVCCDAAGWDRQIAYTRAIEADPAADRAVRTITGHRYSGPTSVPQPTDKRVWMSEWSPDGTTWNESWDDGSGYDGFTVAADIHNTLTVGNANAYVYWVGASLGATRGLIRLADPGDDYRVSKRYWALAAFSRFIRPDAVRVPVTNADPALRTTAFRNTDGSRVIQILNTATTETSAAFTLRGGRDRHPDGYVTDETRSLTPADVVSTHGTTLTATLAPRALTTIVLD